MAAALFERWYIWEKHACPPITPPPTIHPLVWSLARVLSVVDFQKPCFLHKVLQLSCFPFVFLRVFPLSPIWNIFAMPPGSHSDLEKQRFASFFFLNSFYWFRCAAAWIQLLMCFSKSLSSREMVPSSPPLPPPSRPFYSYFLLLFSAIFHICHGEFPVFALPGFKLGEVIKRGSWS